MVNHSDDNSGETDIYTDTDTGPWSDSQDTTQRED